MEKAFELKDLTKEFPEFKLGPLNLDLEPGKVLGYVGPNGSGKTTTMHCMVGLVKADSGKTEIFGRENDPNKIEWKYDIGYVGDKHVFYENWSGAKNLKFISEFYPSWSDKMAEDLIKRFELPIEKRAKDLSSGNRVKLSLVQVLSRFPKLLILDEPTAGLDPVVRTELLDVLFEILEDGEKAIFYSTHILTDISRLADELAFLDNGQVKVKSQKDDLTENWRRISFRLSGNNVTFKNTVDIENEGNNYKVISNDFRSTVNQLNSVGAQNIQETRMGIDEIAVQILKENK
ncbi:MAG: ABC transporter ATP-binding protein [Melioribacteraceae bacterium]|nr:ABC transporter ATP-binding protein [Melioribacteraceae bacterium]